MTGDWWLIGNNQYGVHTARGRTAVEAKAEVRARIIDTYAGEGLPPSAARRAASSYRVFTIAGHLAEAEAKAAQVAWDRGDTGPATRLHLRHISHRGRRDA